MNWLFNAFPHDIANNAGWTLLHSLWQGGLIALFLYLSLYLLRRKSANLKALISTAALALFVVITIATYIIVDNTATNDDSFASSDKGLILSHNKTVEVNGSGVESNLGTTFLTYYKEAKEYLNNSINYIFSIWILGLFFFSLRFFGGALFMVRARRNAVIIKDKKWTPFLDNLCAELNLKKNIELGESHNISVPVAMGIFKPVILFPFQILTGLPQEQIEAIIAHEVAHIKRYDIYINLFQSAVETVFFFNPFIKWISGRIRLEREFCCDDIAISRCGDELIYAKALANLESLINSNMPLFAVPLFENHNQLLRRINRMLQQDKNRNNFRDKFTAAILFIALLVSVALFKNANAQTTAPGLNTDIIATVSHQNAFSDFTSAIDTVKNNKGSMNMEFNVKENGKNNKYRVKLVNEDIVSLSINGKAVPKEEYGKYKDMIAKRVAEHKAAMAQHEIEMKKHEQDMVLHQKEMKQHDLDMKKHEEEMKQHELEMVKHEKEMNLNRAEREKAMVEKKVVMEKQMKQHELEMKKYQEEMVKHNADMQKHEGDMKKYQEEMVKHDKEMVKHEQEMKKHEQDMKIHEAEMKKHDIFMKSLNNLLIDEKIISKGDSPSISFNASRLTVNDREVSKEILNKAKKLYFEAFNKPVEENNGFSVNIKHN